MNAIEKHQIIIVDGGESFASDEFATQWLQKCDWDLMTKTPSWKKWISEGLSDNFSVIRPDMPNTMNAKYHEWKIWFEKYFRYMTELPKADLSTLERLEEKKSSSHKKLILVGHSLGATFLVKYLSENYFPRTIDALHLISPAFDDHGLGDGQSLGTFQLAPHALSRFQHHIPHIHVWASTDDTIVPYDHSVRYHVNLVGSVLHTFHDRGHFIAQAHFVELFQELLKEAHSGNR